MRALAGTIALGSLLGLAIGGAYVLGSLNRTALFRPFGRPEAIASVQSGPKLPIEAVVVSPVSVAATAPRGWTGLRSRFSLEVLGARPFRLTGERDGPDLTCLTQAVYYEARGEPGDGQAAVAQVVLNRVRHPAFPKTICGVVHQRSDAGCQFTFACKDLAQDRVEPEAWRRARRVADQALHGAVMTSVGEATHFQTARGGPFAGLLKVAQIGAHVFYRFAGRDGAASMFHQAAAPSHEVAAAPAIAAPAEQIALASLQPGPTPPGAPAPMAAYKIIDASAAVTAEHAFKAGPAPTKVEPAVTPAKPVETPKPTSPAVVVIAQS